MTRLARTHVLLSEQLNGGLLFTGGTVPLEQPANWVDWASMYDELVFTLSVSAVSGAPTTWSVGARFQYRQMHVGTTYRFQTARWYDLSADNVAADIAEGVGFYGPGQAPPAAGGSGVVATQASDLGTPIVVKRTLTNLPAGVRVKLDLAATGGASPRVKVGLEVLGKCA